METAKIMNNLNNGKNDLEICTNKGENKKIAVNEILVFFYKSGNLQP